MRKPYPSDLTGARWSVIEPLIPVHDTGRPRTNDMREVLHAIFYLNRSGCQWDMLPHDLPAKSTVYDHFARWRDDGTWQRITDALRQKARTATGEEPSPSAGGIDSETVKGSEVGGERGDEGARSSGASSVTSSWARWGRSRSWWSRRRRPMTGPTRPRFRVNRPRSTGAGWD